MFCVVLTVSELRDAMMRLPFIRKTGQTSDVSSILPDNADRASADPCHLHGSHESRPHGNAGSPSCEQEGGKSEPVRSYGIAAERKRDGAFARTRPANAVSIAVGLSYGGK